MFIRPTPNKPGSLTLEVSTKEKITIPIREDQYWQRAVHLCGGDKSMATLRIAEDVHRALMPFVDVAMGGAK